MDSPRLLAGTHIGFIVPQKKLSMPLSSTGRQRRRVRPVLDLNTVRYTVRDPDGHKVEAAFGMSSLLTIP